jgi:predicted secreted Zn-dependent protease
MATETIEKFPTIKIKSKIGKPGTKTGLKVKGKTLDELRDNLNKHDHWGEYSCSASTSYRTDRDKNVTEVGITSTSLIKMPVWSDYSKADKSDKAAWDAMYAKLLKHENNHHALALEVIAKFFQEITDKNGEIDAINKKMEKEKDEAKRDKLKKGFAAMTESVIKARLTQLGKDLQSVQDTYDASSDHGKKEGVKI